MTLVAPSLTALAVPTTRPRIVGIGAARPAAVVSGAQLVAPFGKSPEWLLERTGISELRRLRPGEDLLDLAEHAAVAALAEAGLEPADVDVLIVASCSASLTHSTPLSLRLLERLGCRATPADLNAACAGFCFALANASSLVATGAARTVLVVGAEQMSAMVDPADLGTSILFADGAGAAVVAAAPAGTGDGGNGPGIGPPAWNSEGARRAVLEIPDGRPFLRMAGPQVFRWAVDAVPDVARRAMAAAGVAAEDITVFVPHQANLRIITAVARQLGLEHAVVADDVSESGNTSAASIPMALAKLRRSGSVPRGALALLVGFGAGLSIAGQVVRLP